MATSEKAVEPIKAPCPTCGHPNTFFKYEEDRGRLDLEVIRDCGECGVTLQLTLGADT